MRPILTAQQVRAADAHTIAHEPITSIDLMERASNACVTFMLDRLLALDRLHASAFVVVSGPGNNGGDGAAIARLLRARGFEVRLAVMQWERFRRTGPPTWNVRNRLVSRSLTSERDRHFQRYDLVK